VRRSRRSAGVDAPHRTYHTINRPGGLNGCPGGCVLTPLAQSPAHGPFRFSPTPSPSPTSSATLASPSPTEAPPHPSADPSPFWQVDAWAPSPISLSMSGVRLLGGWVLCILPPSAIPERCKVGPNPARLGRFTLALRELPEVERESSRSSSLERASKAPPRRPGGRRLASRTVPRGEARSRVEAHPPSLGIQRPRT